MQKFPETCLNVYFSGEYSDTDFIVVNAGLYYMFLDFSNQTENEAEQQESLEFSRLCRENLETSLANLPLHLPATTESIVALLIGVCTALYPVYCWASCSCIPCLSLSFKPNLQSISSLRPTMPSKFPSHPSHGFYLPKLPSCARHWATTVSPSRTTIRRTRKRGFAAFFSGPSTLSTKAWLCGLVVRQQSKTAIS
jgi:hypothetical protein